MPLQGGAIWVDEADGLSQQHGGLPWFLDDMRPQGFMGRTFAHAHPELQLGTDPRHWNDDDVLRALALFGDDLPGNLVVGEAAFQRFHTLPQRASRAESHADYPRMAEQAMQGTLSGSSAGGEQPKFCTRHGERHVIVKFSPAGDAPVDQRLRDLLVCEHLALSVLAQAGLPAAKTDIVQGGGRIFLEAERFDRTAQGRIGMVSLMVYDNEYVGEMDNWAATANRMLARGLLTAKGRPHAAPAGSLWRADCQHRPPLRQHLAHSGQRRLDALAHLRHAAHDVRAGGRRAGGARLCRPAPATHRRHPAGVGRSQGAGPHVLAGGGQRCPHL